MTDITAFAQIGVVTWNTYFSERERQTPLQQVAERCNGPAIRLFLAHGNDPDVKNIYGDSARTIARVRCPPGSEANAILNPVVGLFIVYFDWDKTDITPEAASVLDNVVSQFKRRGNVRINLAAYTDTTRSAAYAMGLSEREAASVTAYLTSHGIPAEAISSQAFGNTNLRVQTADGVREQQNRRVEITFGGAKAD